MAASLAFPPELLLKIISYLPIPSIAALQRTSKGFNSLILENEDSVFRRAAETHCLVHVPAHHNLDEQLPQSYSSQSVENVGSWKDLCKRRVSIMRSWSGSEPSRVVGYLAQPRALAPDEFFLDTPSQVHRIKVDEVNGFFLTTSRMGGLVVSDIETGQTLWNLPHRYVRPYAHLEYEGGYAVFDRLDGQKEVWRSESIELSEPVQEDSRTDQAQAFIAQLMNATFTFVHPSDSKRLSPRFVPHAIIPIPSITVPGRLPRPDPTRAYRMVYPCLLAASSTGAYVWDIRTAKRVQTIQSTNQITPTGPEKNIPEGSFTQEPQSKAQEEEEEEEEGVTNGNESAWSDRSTSPEYIYKRAQRLPVISEDEVHFPTHRPFASGLFDRCTPFAVPREPPFSSPIGRFDPLSLTTDLPLPLGFLYYVDFSEKWVFIVREQYLTVYKRTEDASHEPFKIAPGQLALRLPANRIRYGKRKAWLGKSNVRDHPESALVQHNVVWSTWTHNADSARSQVWDRFLAVHVSPDQQHLVVLAASSRIILIPFFERVIYRQADLYDVAIEVQLGSPLSTSIYLAYGSKSNPRIGVVTDTGLFLVTPSFDALEVVDLTIHRVAPFFLDPDRLGLVTCLMMSDTGIWVTWPRGADDEKTLYSRQVNSRLADAGDYAYALYTSEKASEKADLQTRDKEGWSKVQKRKKQKKFRKPIVEDARAEARGFFEWKFIRSLSDPPRVEDRDVVVPGYADTGDENAWFDFADVQQVKFC